MDKLVLKEMDFNKLKNEVKKNKDKELVFASFDDDLNRKVIEKLNVSGILVYLDERKDYMKQRNSGLNEIICRLLSKKKMNVYFDFEELINSKFPERVLARLRQNLFLCEKKGIFIKVLNFGEHDELNVVSLFASIGASTKMCKNLF